MYFIIKSTLKNNRYYTPKYPLNKYSRKQYLGLSVKMETKMMEVFENVTVVAV
jgi:hypothetical protein